MLSEERIREIIHEELAQMLDSMAVAAYRLDEPYETSELKSRAFQVVRKVAEETENLLTHQNTCELRTESRWAECTCGKEN